MHQNEEIYIITIIGIILGLILVGFIVSMLFLYQRRQFRQEKEIDTLRDRFDRELMQSQLEIQENTFKVISQELHDNIGQMLSVVKISLSSLPLGKDHPSYEPVQTSQQVLTKAITDLSHLTKSLHTDRIAQIGLVESIQFELYTLRKTGILQVQFHTTGPEMPLNEQKAIFIFRIFQECLNNILKHSKATEVIVDLEFLEDRFILEIKDNGTGFDINQKRDHTTSSSGVGLKNLYNRAKLIDAELSIHSEAGRGTLVRISLPLYEQE